MSTRKVLLLRVVMASLLALSHSKDSIHVYPSSGDDCWSDFREFYEMELYNIVGRNPNYNYAQKRSVKLCSDTTFFISNEINVTNHDETGWPLAVATPNVHVYCESNCKIVADSSSISHLVILPASRKVNVDIAKIMPGLGFYQVSADNFTLEGITFTMSENSSASIDAAIELETQARNLLLKDCVFENFAASSEASALSAIRSFYITEEDIKDGPYQSLQLENVLFQSNKFVEAIYIPTICTYCGQFPPWDLPSIEFSMSDSLIRNNTVEEGQIIFPGHPYSMRAPGMFTLPDFVDVSIVDSKFENNSGYGNIAAVIAIGGPGYTLFGNSGYGSSIENLACTGTCSGDIYFQSPNLCASFDRTDICELQATPSPSISPIEPADAPFSNNPPIKMSAPEGSSCWNDPLDIVISEVMGIMDPSFNMNQRRTYNLCTDTSISIAIRNETCIEMDCLLFTDGLFPIIVFNPNVHIMCGNEGKITGNCTLLGGQEQIFSPPDGDVLQEIIKSLDVALPDLPSDFAPDTSGLLVEGVTLAGALDVEDISVHSSVQLQAPGIDMMFRDCLWTKSDASLPPESGLSLSWNGDGQSYTGEGFYSSIEVTECTFEDNVFGSAIIRTTVRDDIMLSKSDIFGVRISKSQFNNNLIASSNEMTLSSTTHDDGLIALSRADGYVSNSCFIKNKIQAAPAMISDFYSSITYSNLFGERNEILSFGPFWGLCDEIATFPFRVLTPDPNCSTFAAKACPLDTDLGTTVPGVSPTADSIEPSAPSDSTPTPPGMPTNPTRSKNSSSSKPSCRISIAVAGFLTFLAISIL